MKVHLKKFIVLTSPISGERRQHINKIIPNPIFIFYPLCANRYRSGAIGSLAMLCASDETSVLLEDDVSLAYDLPECFEVPDDADMLYLGISLAGWWSDGWRYETVFEQVHDFPSIVRVTNMLSSHAIMLLSARGRDVYLNSMISSAYDSRPWDINLCIALPTLRAYALKHPLFFQDATFGGAEECTRFLL